jgi:hypothetical protein
MTRGVCSTRPFEATTEGREIEGEGDPGALTLSAATDPTMTKEGAATCRGVTGSTPPITDVEARTREARTAMTMEGAAAEEGGGNWGRGGIGLVATVGDPHGPCKDICAQAHEADTAEGEGTTHQTEPAVDLATGGALVVRLWHDPYNTKEVVPDDELRKELLIR